MRISTVAGTAVLSLISFPALAQDYGALQAANTSVLIDLVKSLQAQDVSAVSKVDLVIDYAPNNHSSSTISPEQMVAMFQGCTPEPITSAQRFSDTTILNFTCPGRKVEGACSTGDLRIMIYRQPWLSLGVMERQRIGPDCKMPAPPAVSSSSGGMQ